MLRVVNHRHHATSRAAFMQRPMQRPYNVYYVQGRAPRNRTDVLYELDIACAPAVERGGTERKKRRRGVLFSFLGFFLSPLPFLRLHAGYTQVHACNI